jgi:PqqD family protein of HPr-rel-A system
MGSNEAPKLPAAREDVVFRQLDDEWVLYDPSANKLHVLNLTAALVWTHLNGKTASPDIAEAIREAFESSDDPGDVVADVENALSRFRAEGLLA